MENQDRKRDLIIEAALKRFAHFGLAKTTMTEIASDLSFSKALLYYYFPDKSSLYAAVLEFLVEKVDGEISEGLDLIPDSVDALNFYLDKRNSYIKKYFNIFEALRSSGPDLPPELLSILDKAKQAEVNQISTSIKKGIEKGEIAPCNPDHAASLLMDAFIGMRVVTFHQKKQFIMDETEFDVLLNRQKELGRIFLRGLTRGGVMSYE